MASDGRWRRCGTALVLTLGALQCGRVDLVEGGTSAQSGGSGVLVNECGGNHELSFGDHRAHIGDACGECSDGQLICASREAFVCVGAKRTKPSCANDVDGGTPNPCGGFEELGADAPNAALGAPCGVCGNGIWTCSSANHLGCFGELADACGGSSGAAGAGDAGAAGALTLDETPCTSQVIFDNGRRVHEGDACGPCEDGQLGCTPFAGPLACGGATDEAHCDDPASATNDCLGIGPLTWRGKPASPGWYCGPCALGRLSCATKNRLVCSIDIASGPQCDMPAAASSCAIPLSAYSASPLHVPSAPPVETKPSTSNFVNTGLPIQSLLYDPFARRLYAGVDASYGEKGDSLAVIEPATRAVLSYIPLDQAPTALALSDDGQVLWAATFVTLYRIDLASLTVTNDYSLGLHALSLAVLPGSHDSVLAYGKIFDSPYQSLRVFDRGVPRPVAADGLSNLVGVTNSPYLAYGFASGYSPSSFTTYCINEQGAFAQRVEQGSPIGFSRRMPFDSGILYGFNGAYDVRKQQIAGTFAASAAVAVDATARRLFVLGGSPRALRAYSLDTFASLEIDGAYPNDGQLANQQFVRWGRYGFAFNHATESDGVGTLYIGRSTLIP